MRKLSKREKVMLSIMCVMLLGVVYYMLFFTPVMNQMDAVNASIQSTQDEITLTDVKAAQMEKMQAELEEIKKDGNAVRLASYDNSRAVMNELNLIMASSTTYSLSFASVDTSAQIVRRAISVQYTANGYTAARQILDRLHDSAYRCLISDVSIANGSSETSYWSGSTYTSAAVTVNLTITYFEYQA